MHFLIAFLFTVISFSVDLPLSSGAHVDPRFLNCSQAFSCGDITNIYYPFWGNGRADYCGHRDYQLNCRNGSVEMEIESQRYRVLSISEQRNTIQIVPMETWNDDCPTPYQNSSLHTNLFNHNIGFNQYVTLWYGCSLDPQLETNNSFPCAMNGVDGRNYFGLDTTEVPFHAPSGCNFSLTAMPPVLKTVVERLTVTPSTVVEVLKRGFEVSYDPNNTFCNTCEGSGGQCGYEHNMSFPTCFCSNGSFQQVCPPAVNRANVGNKVAIGLSTVGAVFMIITLIYCCKKKQSAMFWKREHKAQKAVEDILKTYGSLALKRFTYSDVKKITRSFRDKIGQGGFGGVYKGELLDGRLVAVKLLNKSKGDGEAFINEVASISKTSHVNVVSLLGFSFDGPKRALIYEFMPNGSLEKFIYDETQTHLGWEALYKIAIGVARGLEYLHRGCNTRILHFDIKPHNILLDQNFIPKISDFGLAKLCPRNESIISMLDARGTAGYIAPEVFSRNFGRVSHKSDVYSYGMMVLEIVGKRGNFDGEVGHTSEIYFPHWIHQRLEIDEYLGLDGVMSTEEEEITRKMILVALWCIQTHPMDRPAMSRVVEMLEGRIESLPIPPQPYQCSPARDSVGSSNT